MDNIKNLLYLIPVMIYYFVESMITGLFVALVWRVFLADFTGVNIRYFQWVAIIWILKVILFDVFKLIGAFMITPPQNQGQNNNEYNQN